jgi:hypothetical protein
MLRVLTSIVCLLRKEKTRIYDYLAAGIKAFSVSFFKYWMIQYFRLDNETLVLQRSKSNCLHKLPKQFCRSRVQLVTQF